MGATGDRRGPRRDLLAVGAVVIALFGAGALFLLSRNNGDDGDGGAASNTTVGVDEGVESRPIDEPVAPALAASDAGMVPVEAGSYTVGVENPGPNDVETGIRTVEVAGYWIDQHEVTNAQWARFVEAGGVAPESWGDLGRFDDRLANHPVRGVPFEWAQTYCVALGKRLPSEIEWEIAARGTTGALVPWGEAAPSEVDEEGTYEVGSVPANVSELGVADLVGNVWEWVGDTYDPQRADGGSLFLKGGQNGYVYKASQRLIVPAEAETSYQGFRCAASEVDTDRPADEFEAFSAPASLSAEAPADDPDVIVAWDFEDPLPVWSGETLEDRRWGYHPHGFFHLEATASDVEVIAEAPANTPQNHFRVRTLAFVEPQVTSSSGTFAYGLLAKLDEEGRGIFFILDPRDNRWLLCTRELVENDEGELVANYGVVDIKRRNIDENSKFDLEIRDLGDDRYEFYLNGEIVTSEVIVDESGRGFDGTGVALMTLSYSNVTNAHIHYDDLEVLELGSES